VKISEIVSSARLSALLGNFDFPVRCVGGPPSLSAVAVSTEAGEIVLR
jgi:hypothetical protein